MNSISFGLSYLPAAYFDPLLVFDIEPIAFGLLIVALLCSIILGFVALAFK